MDQTLADKTAVLVGGTRGLGRGAVQALTARGAHVTVIGREEATLAALKNELPGISITVGDGADEALAARVLSERNPDLLVIVAGVPPVLAPFHEQTWAEYETNWRADTKIAFAWLKQALRTPMKRGSHTIVVSSGAAAQGSPASGGYAPAKRAQWFLADYAASEIERANLGIRVHCLLPNINPSTDLGRAGIAAYAKRAGISDEEFVKRFGPPLTPAIFGDAIAALAIDPERWPQRTWRVGGAGLFALS
jgi:NAD(P)-dependent dehydrogenase (short-subunit alcohol dehydrogenase family)